MSAREIISATALVKHYPVKKGRFGEKAFARAVDGITLSVNEGENLAVVGESGCGKTTLGRMLAGLVEPTAGTIRVGGGSAPRDRKEFARLVQPIFQDPYSALNPQKTVRATLAKPFKVHGMRFDDAKLASLLEEVGLSPGTSFLDRYAHELSGGQRQRIVIARALALRPKLIIADEPFSGLDATLLSQTIKLMEGLQQKFGITYVVISHDIAAVESMCKKMMVVYLGKTVEYGPTAEVIKGPVHPYTVSLLRSFPSGNPSDRKWIDEPPIAGDVPSALSPPPGCRFHPRCPLAVDDCRVREPELVAVSPGHFVACPVVLASRKR